MSPDGEGQDTAPDPLADHPCSCVGARMGTDRGHPHYRGTDRGHPHYRRGPEGLEPVPNIAGEGPCCDAPRWPHCRDCPHYPPISRVIEEMDEARPADAPPPEELGDRGTVDDVQMEAFCLGVEQWWLLGSEDDLAHALAAEGREVEAEETVDVMEESGEEV